MKKIFLFLYTLLVFSGVYAQENKVKVEPVNGDNISLFSLKEDSLAAARLTEYRYKFAFAKFNAHAFKRVHRGIPGNIVLFNIFQFKHPYSSKHMNYIPNF